MPNKPSRRTALKSLIAGSLASSSPRVCCAAVGVWLAPKDECRSRLTPPSMPSLGLSFGAILQKPEPQQAFSGGDDGFFGRTWRPTGGNGAGTSSERIHIAPGRGWLRGGFPAATLATRLVPLERGVGL